MKYLRASRWMSYPPLFSILFVLFLLGACTQDAPEEDASETLEKIKVRLSTSPDRLNPMLSASETATHIENLIMPALAEFDPVTLQLQPVLIDRVPTGLRVTEGEYEGKMLYTMKLRQEARWPDGSPLTVEDYLFTLKAVFNPFVKASWRNILSDIVSVHRDEEDPKVIYTLLDSDIVLGQSIVSNFNLYPKYAYDPQGLMDEIPFEELRNLPEEELEQKYPSLREFADQFLSDEYSRNKVIGAGPYQLQSWQENVEISLSKKEDFWGAHLSDSICALDANPASIVYKVISDENTAITALKEGAIDIMSDISSDQFRQLQSAGLPLDFHSPEIPRYYYIAMNQESELLGDLRTRQALAHLLDIDEIIDKLMDGYAKRVQGPISPSATYFHEELKEIPYDLTKAKNLLADAGWKDSNGDGILDQVVDGRRIDLKLSLKTTPRRLGQNIAFILRENAKKVGVAIEVDAKAFNAYLEDIQNGEFHLANLANVHSQGLYDPYGYWHTDNLSPNGRNYMKFGNPTSDKAIETIRSTHDEAERLEAYLSFQEEIYNNQPAIFLFSPARLIACNEKYTLLTSSRRPGFFEQSITLDQVK